MAKILKIDRYQKGEDEIAATYGTAEEAIREILKGLHRHG